MSELVVRPLADAEVESLGRLAREIWLAHYPAIISLEQIDFMLNERYSPAAIRASMAGQCWRTAWIDGAMAGFAHGLPDEAGSWKLDKLYVHSRHQRKGIGAALVRSIAEAARAAGACRLVLRVNRHNAAALEAYAKYGFKVYGEHVLDIGNGFVMDDYLLELNLCS